MTTQTNTEPLKVGEEPEYDYDLHALIRTTGLVSNSDCYDLVDLIRTKYIPKQMPSIERALNQHSNISVAAVKEGEAVVRRLIECRSSVAFDLRNYEQLILRKGESVNQCDHDEANRLQSLLDFIDELREPTHDQ